MIEFLFFTVLMCAVVLGEPWALVRFFPSAGCATAPNRESFVKTGCIDEGQNRSSNLQCESSMANAVRTEYGTPQCQGSPQGSANVPFAPTCFNFGGPVHLTLECINQPPSSLTQGTVVVRQFSGPDCSTADLTSLEVRSGGSDSGTTNRWCNQDDRDPLSVTSVHCNSSGIWETTITYASAAPSAQAIGDGSACDPQTAAGASVRVDDMTARAGCQTRDADETASEQWTCENVVIETAPPTAAPTPEPFQTLSPTPAPTGFPTPAWALTLSEGTGGATNASGWGPDGLTGGTGGGPPDTILLVLAVAGPVLLGALALTAWCCYVRSKGGKLEFVAPQQVMTRRFTGGGSSRDGGSGGAPPRPRPAVNQQYQQMPLPSEPCELLDKEVPYYGDVSGRVAYMLLHDKPRGSYLVRDNVDRPDDQIHRRVLSYVDHASGEVAHLPLALSADGKKWRKANSDVEHASALALLAWLPLGLRLSNAKPTPHYSTAAFSSMTIKNRNKHPQPQPPPGSSSQNAASQPGRRRSRASSTAADDPNAIHRKRRSRAGTREKQL